MVVHTFNTSSEWVDWGQVGTATGGFRLGKDEGERTGKDIWIWGQFGNKI